MPVEVKTFFFEDLGILKSNTIKGQQKGHQNEIKGPWCLSLVSSCALKWILGGLSPVHKITYSHTKVVRAFVRGLCLDGCSVCTSVPSQRRLHLELSMDRIILNTKSDSLDGDS